MNRKDYNGFLEELGFEESSNRYDVVNQYGYLGRYQMGEYALIAAGYYKKTKNIGNNDWKGTFTGKNNVYSKETFLKNEKAQDDSIRAFHKSVWKIAKAEKIDKYIGTTRGGAKITQAGIIAGYHNQGSKVFSYIRTDGKVDTKDGNGTPVSKYIKKFSEYDVTEITQVQQHRSNKPSSQEYVIKPSPTPSKSVVENEVEPKRNFLQQIKFEQDEKLSAFNERLSGAYMDSSLEKRFHGNVPKGYKNKETNDERIFTKEQIESMTSSEKEKHKKAINYQKKMIGLPTEKEAKQAVSKGGMSYVES